MRRAALLLALLAGRLSAQDSTCRRGPAVGTIPAVVFGELAPTKPTRDLPKPYLAHELDAIRESLRIGGPLQVPTFDAFRKDSAIASARVAVQFRILSSGRIDRLYLIGSSLSGTLDGAVLGAVARADSAHRFDAPTADARDSVTVLRLLVYESPARSDSAILKEERDEPKHAVRGPLFQTSVPVWTHVVLPSVDRSAELPPYPENARAQGVEDEMSAFFAIDETGAVIPSTAYIGDNPYADFGKATLEWLLKARFHPGFVAGCPATMVVQLPFSFKLRR